jgi:CTP:molybdopterin cytidylyltransferase MocA/SAM-dependent methyltransferase
VTDPGRTTAIVLAAGAGSRFGGGKLQAELAGKPVAQHVLDRLAEAGLTDVVVVLGDDAADLEAALDWRSERRIHNPDPGRGLSSSVRLGLAAVPADAAAVLIALGDQPLLDPEVLQALLGAPDEAGRPIVVPVYAHDQGRNPVLLRPAAWDLAAGLEGDRGFGPLITAHPGLVLEVPVGSANPDVDTPGDLAALAWGLRVRANREQAERVREAPAGPDFYEPITGLFRADPQRTDDPVLAALLEEVEPSDVWLDVGAGAGRFGLPIALRAREVIALDPSPGMLTALAELASEQRIDNIRTIEARWPAAGAADLHADASLIAHVGYDIEAIGRFLDALEAATRRQCVAIMNDVTPAAAASAFWPAIHGEARAELPALPEFVELLRARGREPRVRPVEREPRAYPTRADLLRWVRQQLYVEPGSQRDRRLVGLVEAATIEIDGGVRLAHQRSGVVGVVTWQP